MKINVKRLITPLICAMAGLFNLIFMFMNYSAVFFSAGVFSESEGFSAYKSITFGEESVANALEEMLSAMIYREAHATFFLSLTSFLFVIMIILSVGLMLAGAVGLVREFAGVNLLGGVHPKVVVRISKIMLLINFIINIAAATFVSLTCLINLYVGNNGMSISLGLRPGIGMFFLLTFAVAEWIVSIVLEKKLSSAPAGSTAAPIYQCSICGEKATATDMFCTFCGASIVKKAPVQNEEAVSTISEEKNEETNNATPEENASDDSYDNVKNFDYSVISSFFKKIFNKIKEFLKEKNISPKMLYIAGGAVLAVIVLIIVLACIPWGQSASYIIPESDISYVYNAEDDETIIMIDGELAKDTIEGEVSDAARSLDGETIALLSSDGTLYVYNDGDLITVSEDVERFKLSAEGAAIAYINDDDELIHYTIKNEKSERITDEPATSSTDFFHLSPDGKYVAYAEGDYDDFVLCVYSDGEREKLEDNAYPLGLSNKAKLIYYYSQEKDAVYVMEKDEDPVKLASKLSEAYSYQLIYNADHTQALFSIGNNCYISDNGQEKVKISSKSIGQFGDYTWGLISGDSAHISTSPILNYEEQYFIDASGTLYYIDKKFETVEVAEDVKSFKTTASADVVYYLNDDGELYRGKGYNKEFEQVADDVYSYSYVITSDGKACYYIDTDDTLRYVKKENKSKKIAQDVYNLRITHDDYALFLTDYSYASSGTLYESHNGKEKERIAEDVTTLSTTATSASYHVEDGNAYDIYCAVKKAKFNVVVKDVSKY